jgi:polyphosphate kinase 2 (PPK2 family)
VPIDLTQFERGAPFTGDGSAELVALQDRLAMLQRAQIVHRKRAIILFEGWHGAGKKAALKKLTAALDPCHFVVHDVGVPNAFEGDRHWLAPFWSALPAAGQSSIFYRSWYRRASEEMAMGKLSPKGLARILDEVNEFESQQCDHGTTVIKLFFHVSEAVQEERMKALIDDPWARHLVTEEDISRVHRYRDYLPLMSDVFDQTNTRWAPWKVIDAADREAAQIAALGHVAATLEKSVPQQPPEVQASADILDFRRAKIA